MSKSDDIYLDLKGLAKRSSLCERSLRSFLKDSEYPLRHYKVRGKILVSWVDFVNWMERFRVHDDHKVRVQNIVDEIVA